MKMMMTMITAFGATNVPVATTKIILTITEIRKRSKEHNNQCNLPPLHKGGDGDEDYHFHPRKFHFN